MRKNNAKSDSARPNAARRARARAAAALLLAALAAVMAWNAHAELRDLTALETRGTRVAAAVTAMHIVHSRHTDYYIFYTFSAAGVPVAGSENVAKSVYDATEIGSALPVTYLASHPQTNRLGPVTPARLENAKGAWTLAFVLLTVCGGIFYAAIPFYIK